MSSSVVGEWLKEYEDYNSGKEISPPRRERIQAKKMTAYELEASRHPATFSSDDDKTSQFEPLVGREESMVENDAGGYVFKVSPWTRLDRFLIMGSEGGTYYASEQKFTKENAESFLFLLDNDPFTAIDRVVEISTSRRGIKNDPCLFCMALASAHENVAVRSYAMKMMAFVARTGGDFLRVIPMIRSMRGGGNMFNNMMRHWYQDQSPDALAYQVAKYQTRGKWSHKDVLRLSHPKAYRIEHNAIYGWITGGIESLDEKHASNLPDVIRGLEMIKATNDSQIIEKIIKDYNLTWEFVPSEKRTPEVWEVLSKLMPMQALLRWLPTMTELGILEKGKYAHETVIERLSDLGYIHASKIHPMNILVAWITYRSGVGVRSGKTWSPVPEIIAVLESAFYSSFENVEPTGLRHMIALDVSDSMNSFVGSQNFTVREAALAMSMSILRSEDIVTVVGFSGDGIDPKRFDRFNGKPYGLDNSISILPFNRDIRLERAIHYTNKLKFGGTDCSLPMLYALGNNIPVDIFSIWTDNQTWAGEMHPSEALLKYRKHTGIQAKLFVCAMTATNFSIADPDDAGMLDVVGFDTNLPRILSEFAKARW